MWETVIDALKGKNIPAPLSAAICALHAGSARITLADCDEWKATSDVR